jgi:hypothetical protein
VLLETQTVATGIAYSAPVGAAEYPMLLKPTGQLLTLSCKEFHEYKTHITPAEALDR